MHCPEAFYYEPMKKPDELISVYLDNGSDVIKLVPLPLSLT